MKGIEIDSSKWSEEQIRQGCNKLEELGYEPRMWHGTKSYNGKKSITAYDDGEYCGYDLALFVLPDDLTPTFDELMAMTKEDVQ